MTLLTPIRLGLLGCLVSLGTAWSQNAPANPPANQPQPASRVIEGIEFHGMSRVPEGTLRATILSKVGDIYDEEALRRDFTALWNTGSFEEIRMESKPGDGGGLIVNFVVTEPKVIEKVEFRGVMRVPESTLRAIISSKAGDVGNAELLQRDLAALSRTGRFAEIRIEKETTERGGMIVRFVVTELPLETF